MVDKPARAVQWSLMAFSLCPRSRHGVESIGSDKKMMDRIRVYAADKANGCLCFFFVRLCRGDSVGPDIIFSLWL